MATSEILPFAFGVGANVQTQAEYAAEPLRDSGNVAGIARSNVNNKALRQASLMASALAQFMADNQSNNITDDQTPATIAGWLETAIQAQSPIDYLNTTRIDVASAATVNLTSSAPNTRHINITGTTAITAFTVAAGKCYFVRFNASLTLTNNASIVTNRGTNITTQAGDTCIIRATAANVVEVLSYVENASAQASLATNGYQKLPSGLIVQWGYASNATAGQITVTFPIAFPTAFRFAVATPVVPVPAGVDSAQLAAFSSTQATFNRKASGGGGVISNGNWDISWIALGH